MRLQGFEKRSFDEEFFGEQIIGSRCITPLHLDLDKLLKEQIRYRGNQEQRQAKKEMVQHLQKTVLDQTQMQIDLHVRGRNQ